MVSDQSTWIGVFPNPQPGKSRGFLTYAAMDERCHLLALSQGGMEDLRAYVGGQSAACVAIAAPRRPSLNIPLTNAQESLFPSSQPVKKQRSRLADRQLREHNLGHPRTPASYDACPGWMKRGFKIYEMLHSMGYQDYPADDHQYILMEVYPHAVFTLLSGESPLPRKSLEGRLQRQLLLNDRDVDVPDPMRFFEEVTRYRLRNGILPLKEVYSAPELDALASAYTAWLATHNPQAVMLYGDDREGQVVVPVGLMMPQVKQNPAASIEFAPVEQER